MKVPVSMEAFMQLSPGGVIYQGPKTMVQFVVQSTKMHLKDPKYINLVGQDHVYKTHVCLN